jgi:hypothetical protein
MKTIHILQAEYRVARTRTEQDRLLVEMHNHPDKGLELIYDGRYVTVYQKPLGSLVLRPTAELLTEYRDPVSNGDRNGLVYVDGRNAEYPDNLYDLLEDWLCNSEYELVRSAETGDLVDDTCPIILNEVDRNDDGITGYSDKWYFSQSAIRNEYYDLYLGALFLDKA